MEKKEFVCKFCNKKFPSGKSLGGHIRIHSPNLFSVDGMKKNNKKRSVDQREITPPPKQQQQHQCRVCRKSFCSLKALANHMDCHNDEVGEEKMVMGTHQSASETTTTTTTTTTSSGPTMMNKRSKKKHSSSDKSYSIVKGAKDLMFCHLGRKDYKLAVNSMVDESSENNSELSSGELLKKTDKVAAAADDDDEGASDSDSSDDDYFLNGPKKSDADISFGGSLWNTGVVGSGFNSFSYGDDEVRNKEGGGSKHHELGKSKRVWSEGMAAKKASGANGNSRGHECPVCFKVYSSGHALGGHKRHCKPRTEEEDQTQGGS